MRGCPSKSVHLSEHNTQVLHGHKRKVPLPKSNMLQNDAFRSKYSKNGSENLLSSRRKLIFQYHKSWPNSTSDFHALSRSYRPKSRFHGQTAFSWSNNPTYHDHFFSSHRVVQAWGKVPSLFKEAPVTCRLIPYPWLKIITQLHGYRL